MKKFLVLVKQTNEDTYTILNTCTSEAQAWCEWAYNTSAWDNAMVIPEHFAKQYSIKIKSTYQALID